MSVGASGRMQPQRLHTSQATNLSLCCRAPSALEDLLPQPAVAQPGVAEHIPAAIVPLVTVVEGSSAGQQAVQPLTVAAAGPAVGPPAATPAAAPSSTPAAASTAPTSLPAAVEAVVVGAVVPAAAAAPAALAASQQVQPKTEDVRPKQEAGEYQGRGGRGGGRGGRGSRGRGRGGADYNRSYGPFIEEGQEPTGDASHFKMPADVVLKQEIPLPRRMASCVIGIKGTTVSKLRRDSGSKIHVRPGIGQAELDQVVEIEGSIEAVGARLTSSAGVLTSCAKLKANDHTLQLVDVCQRGCNKPVAACGWPVH